MHKRLPAILLLCGLMLAYPRAVHADAAPVSAPLTAGSTQNGTVRVRLSSLGNFTSLNLTLTGGYSVDGQPGRALNAGDHITVRFNAASGKWTLISGGASADMGSSFRLCRKQTEGQSGAKIAQSGAPGNVYPGDLHFFARSGGGSYAPWVIAHVYMEDYLCGVLPYEMGDAAGLEALKAQAVAARTYTLLRMSEAGSALYDVVDTTADQVYAGTPSGHAACRSAVDATRGVAVKNGSAFTATYYTASNGGQTESIQNAWGTRGLGYLCVKDDPYDLANPDSRKASFSVNAQGPQSDSRVAALLDRKAAALFGPGASVAAVYAVYAHTPKYAAPSRLYTALSFDVGYIRNGQAGNGALTFDIFSELEGPLSMGITSGPCELWSVTEENGRFTVTARRYGHGIGMSQRGAMYMAALGFTYDQILGFYYEGCARVAYTLIRSAPAAGSGQAQAAPTPQAELYARVTTSDGALNLRQSPSTSAQVLGAVPQYAVIPIYEQSGGWCKTMYNGVTGYVTASYLTFPGDGSAPSASQNTPASTPARVATPGGSLNLRQFPSASALVLRAIPQDAQVAVTEKGGEWCRVAYDGVSGYVMTRYLSFPDGASAQAPRQPDAQEEPALTPLQTPIAARVMSTAGSLNLRDGCSLSARVLLEMPRHDLVLVTALGEVWCAVQYEGRSGYCMTAYLEFITE